MCRHLILDASDRWCPRAPNRLKVIDLNPGCGHVLESRSVQTDRLPRTVRTNSSSGMETHLLTMCCTNSRKPASFFKVSLAIKKQRRHPHRFGIDPFDQGLLFPGHLPNLWVSLPCSGQPFKHKGTRRRHCKLQGFQLLADLSCHTEGSTRNHTCWRLLSAQFQTNDVLSSFA